MPKEDKSTRVRFEQRVNLVHRLLLSGSSRFDIFRYVSELAENSRAERAKVIPRGEKPKYPDPWNVCKRQVENYIAVANQLFKPSAQFERDLEFGKAVERREFLYQSNLRLQDFGKALSAEQDRCRLLELYPVLKVEITPELESPYAHLTEKEIDFALATLDQLAPRQATTATTRKRRGTR